MGASVTIVNRAGFGPVTGTGTPGAPGEGMGPRGEIRVKVACAAPGIR